jgi:hypothetical protein
MVAAILEGLTTGAFGFGAGVVVVEALHVTYQAAQRRLVVTEAARVLHTPRHRAGERAAA